MVYIHIPFCDSFCTYCGFYSEISGGAVRGKFTEALVNEIRSREGEIPETPDTLYIGGGTPSVLPLSAVYEISSAVKRSRSPERRSFREFTFEVNPEDIVTKGLDYVKGLAVCGVNRISMGLQSFDDSVLKWMNRRHNAETALTAYGMIRDAGIGNVSVDLIFGISHLEDHVWEETVDKAIALRPEHISAYQLSVEPDSALAGMVKKGSYREAPESVCGKQYEILCSKLGKAGYRHYEISNFALPGYEAVHNSAYWTHVPYAGFGPGAHSFLVRCGVGMTNTSRKHIRFWNVPDISKYIAYYSTGEADRQADALEAAVEAGVKQCEALDQSQLSIEHIMLGLRTDRGVERSYLESHADRHRLEKMVDNGFLVRAEESSFLRIPEKHFFISDSIIADII